MHETSLAQSLISLAENHLKEIGAKTVTSLTVRVGRLSGVMPDALLFAFDVLKQGTSFEAAGLIIEETAAACLCRACGREFEFEGPYALECPHCGGRDFRIIRGRELELYALEVED